MENRAPFPPFQTVRILGVRFFNDRFERALEAAHRGGLILAPSGPGLAELGLHPDYDEAVLNADLNLIDSGYLALLWRKRCGEELRRHSGLKFVKGLVEDPTFKRNPRQLWVMPSAEHIAATRSYLAGLGIELPDSCFYEAPFYRERPVRDPALLEKVKRERPDYVLVCIAGGKQEGLGYWLRTQLDHRPAIVCIGAAIAFLSGQQARIPVWADRIFIGWLLRILADPGTFLPRYWKARKLSALVRRHGADFPGPDRARVDPAQEAEKV